MNSFEFWTRWGSSLSDKEFANAWVALGLMTSSAKAEKPGLSKNPATGINIRQELRKVLSQLMLPLQAGKSLQWNFPVPSQPVPAGADLIQLSALDPLMVAEVWRSLASTVKTVRIVVRCYPQTEMIRPWFRLFSLAEFISAAYLDLPGDVSPVELRWPLRLGYFAENPCEKIIKDALRLFPSAGLAIPVAINRDNANCDILCFQGTLDQLVKTSVDLPSPLKCNLFILKGPLDEEAADLEHWLKALSSRSRANGFIFINPDAVEVDFEKGLKIFINELSKDISFDTAIRAGFVQKPSLDPVVVLSDQLAGYSIKHLIKKLQTRLLRMPAFKMKSKPRGHIMSEMMDFGFAPETSFLSLKSKSMMFEESPVEKISSLNREMVKAESETDLREKRSARFIQSKLFITRDGQIVEEKQVLYKNVRSLIRVRIGPLDQDWSVLSDNELPVEFPVDKLPPDVESWRLTVVLSEANHLEKQLVNEIRLPKDGPSTECDFYFTPGKNAPFEGRITVLHRGRVIQTCIIKISVVSAAEEIIPGSHLEMTELIPVFSDLGNLETRRQFDLALVENHTSDQMPRLTAIANNHAWLKNLSDCDSIVKEINTALSRVAMSVKDYSGGFDSKNSQNLMVKLAQYGCYLYNNIVEDQLQKQSGTYDSTKMRYIQVVSTRPESVIPFEFIYDHTPPDDDAPLCPLWNQGLKDEKCRQDCNYNDSGHVCPLGFWGLSKVIERHIYTPDLDPEGKDYYLQSEETGERSTLSVLGPTLVSASQNVKENNLNGLIEYCKENTGSDTAKAGTWDEWLEIVKAKKPKLILALPHTTGSGAMMALEIGGMAKKSIQINRNYVCSEDSGVYPLVVLLGCDTTGTCQDYGSHVSQFRRDGAAIVIGTIATVFGEHAVSVAKMLVSELTRKQPEIRIGDVILALKKNALLKGLLMSLCIVAFGDADWKLNNNQL